MPIFVLLKATIQILRETTTSKSEKADPRSMKIQIVQSYKKPSTSSGKPIRILEKPRKSKSDPKTQWSYPEKLADPILKKPIDPKSEKPTYPILS